MQQKRKIDGNKVVSLFTGDRLAARQIKDALIFSGDFLHKRAGGLYRRKHTPVKDTRDAWGILTVTS